jgi:hypothetical protein
LVPTRPTVGNNVIFATTVNVATPKSVPGAPVTITGDGPEGAPATTINEPLTVPPEIEQGDAAVTAGPAIAQVRSVVAKPVPETNMTAPIGPKDGVRVTTRGIMLRVAVAIAVPSLTVIRSLRPPKVTTTEKEPVNVKSALTVQVGALTEGPVIPGAHTPGVLKLVPVTATGPPTRCRLGDNDILGTTVKDAVTPSPVLPASSSVLTSAPLFAVLTTNEPVAVPPEILHEGGGVAAIVFPNGPTV